MPVVVMRVPNGRRLRAVAIGCVALLAGCGGGHHGAARSRAVAELTVNASGYRVPVPLPAATPGVLIAAHDAAGKAQELGAADAWQVLYHSSDLSGHDIAVSALVLVPSAPPPATGWPVVAWAHGTSGLADQCAPSIAPGLAHDPTAVHEVRALLAHGWLVVASDYPGLGTPGIHTYLIGEADARAVIDSVTATHALLGVRAATGTVALSLRAVIRTAAIRQMSDVCRPKFSVLFDSHTRAASPAAFAVSHLRPTQQCRPTQQYRPDGFSAPTIELRSVPTNRPR